MRVPLAPSGLRPKDIDAMNQVFHSGKLTMGEKVAEFEVEMSKYLGSEYFVMVNSGSSANLAIVEALIRPSSGEQKLKVGDGILVPSIAWPTTIWPIIQLGLKPIFVDVRPDTLELDLEKAEQQCLSSKTPVKGLFPIHPLGYGIETKKLIDFSNAHRLVLMNDVCESLGSWQHDGHSGLAGEGSSFSFYFSHHMTTMEGGGISTNSETIFNDLKSIRSHGWSRDRGDIKKWGSKAGSSMQKFQFVSTGFNIRPMEIQGAVGLEQLKDLDSFIEKRRKNVQQIAQSLDFDKVTILGVENRSNIWRNRKHSWMHVPIRLNSVPSRELLHRAISFLENEGIETRPPLTGNFVRQPAMSQFASKVNIVEDFPVADEISNSTFLIGCHHDLSDSQVDFLCDRLRLLCSKII